jgi:hypothetical protein
MDLSFRLKALYLLLPLFRPAKRHFTSRISDAAKGNPTQDPSLSNTTPPSEPFTAMADTPASQRETRKSFI